MSRNGTGTYTLPAGNPVVTGTTISSTWANNTLSDIATALTQSLAKDGQTVPTANIPLGGFKITGLGAPTTAGDALAFGSSLGAVTATTGTFSGNVQMASQNGGQLAGLRNKIINGNMGIFQRGTAAVTVSGTYGPADRWQNASVGDTFSTTQGSFVSGDTLFDTGGAQYFTQIAVTSVAAAGNYMAVGHKIEDVRLLAGQTVTVSFWAKAASGTPSIGLEIVQSFGAGGSPSLDVTGTGQAQALTTTWTQYSKTFVVPSINGKTIGTTANTSFTALNFWLDAGATNNTRSGSIGQSSKTVSIAQVQVEVGPVATPFEQRPYGMELALCQRYYEIAPFSFILPNSVSGNNNGGTAYWKVDKRAAPTVAQVANNVTFTQQNVGSTSTYILGGLFNGVTVYRVATASSNVQFSETMSASAEL
jgi:hypothetical protein